MSSDDRPEHEAFSEVFGALDYPMLVVTVAAGEEVAGCLVGFSSQCSLEPPRHTVWLSDKNRTYKVALRSDALLVHVLAPEHLELARLFGTETGDVVDKFARCRWERGPEGLPLLLDCDRWYAGRVVERRLTGDHMGFLLEPFQVSKGSARGQLGFQQVSDLEPGHGA